MNRRTRFDTRPLLPQDDVPQGSGSGRPTFTAGSLPPSRSRVFSQSSLDPNEDPVSGLDRVSSINNIQAMARRNERRRWHMQHQSAERPRAGSVHDRILSEKYESLDYEIIDNELYRTEETSSDHQKQLFRLSLNRWVVCFLIGIVTGVVAAFIDILVYYSAQVKFHVVLNNLINICDKSKLKESGCAWVVLSAWAIYNCILVGIGAALVLFVSPVAAGSGIPQIKCFLNGVQIPGVVRLKTLFAKAIGVSCSVAGGLAAGKEGPMIHSGAVIAAGISQGRCLTFPIDFNVFRYFRNDREKRDFVSAGAAAGVAAAFGAPIGGVLFSLEEGASFWNQASTWRMFFSAMISSFTVSSLLSVFYGQSGMLSWNGLANFGVFENNSYNIWEIPFFLLIGVLGGVFGAFFNYLNVHLTKFRKHYVRTTFQKFFECILVAVTSAFVGFITLFLVDDCQPMGVDPNLTEATKLWCPKGKYSAVANLFFQNPEESVKSLFHSPFNAFHPTTLLIFAVEYFLLTLWTFGLNVSSGVFIPTLLTGAAWGRLVGVMAERMFPSLTGIDPGKYALAGAAAQLGGVARMTISLTAIIVEATKDITFGLPIMLVLMITKFVGDLFNEGLYDSHIEIAEIPFLDWNAPKLCRNILAKKIMRRDVVALEPIENVSRLVDILLTTRHHGFPIVDRISEPSPGSLFPNYGHLKGLLLRSQLFVILRKRHFTHDYDGRHPVEGAKPVALSDFSDSYPRYEVPISRLNLSTTDLKCYVDLRPFLHQSPHRVPLNASLGSIFTLFRGLGLRFLCAVDDENRLRGFITRKDIARFKERRVKKQYLVSEVYISHYAD
uniref:Chloride channel protein n=1 Tax=Panagrellus redivivus TaxID=6233 RepID=A0A7E4VYC5_PANRE